jgi:hypothetical protein
MPRIVGVYDRPHPLRTRKVIVPLALATVLVAVACAVWLFVG